MEKRRPHCRLVVIHSLVSSGRAYLKLTVIDDLMVVSFKELDP